MFVQVSRRNLDLFAPNQGTSHLRVHANAWHVRQSMGQPRGIGCHPLEIVSCSHGTSVFNAEG